MSGPLAGVRVVDLSAVMSGPLATSVLAEQGADVIKVEVPGRGDLTRSVGSSVEGLSALFCLVNRGKRSLALDLSSAEGRVVLARLVARADVVVQNFRPGVVERMGVGWDDLRVVNPGLVYVSISGLGSVGPLAQHKVFDNLVQAVSGLAALQGAGGDPVAVQTLVCDKVTALTAAQAITAALLARARGGPGQHVELNMLDATVAFLWPDAGAGAAFTGAGPPAPAREKHQFSRHRDGWVACMPVTDAEFRGWCRAMGDPDLADDPRFATTAQRFNDPALPAERRRVQTRTATLEVAEVLARLAAEGLSAVPVVALEDLPEHPQVIANGTFGVQAHPVVGPVRAPNPAAHFGVTAAEAGAPAPRLGQHTDEVLAEIGCTLDEVRALRAAGVVA